MPIRRFDQDWSLDPGAGVVAILLLEREGVEVPFRGKAAARRPDRQGEPLAGRANPNGAAESREADLS